MKPSFFEKNYIKILYYFYIGYNVYVLTRRYHMAKRGRPVTDNVQINIAIPLQWKTELENLARVYSIEEGCVISMHELIRRGIKEKYQLEEPSDDRG